MLKNSNDNDNGHNLPWVEKYRPEELSDLVSQNDIVDTITRFMDSNRLPHLLFHGPPGTGKTSTILACAKQLYKENWGNMVLELNASDDRGIDVVRNQIMGFASTQRMVKGQFKLIILDEADAMTQAAQAALRRVIEKFTSNVRFCLICNYVSKIIPALQSRCTRFRFAPLESDQIMGRLNEVIHSENIKITDEAKDALLKVSKGDMRKVLNILQACNAAFDVINLNDIYLCTGLPVPEDIEKIVDLLMNAEFNLARQLINEIKRDKGLALQDILTDIYPILMSLVLPQPTLSFLLSKLAELEANLASGTNEALQVIALIGTFKLAVESIPIKS